jgi:hypothetical protein
MIRVFIGYDQREAIAFHVLSSSIQERSSLPVSITPLRLMQLRGLLRRPRDPLQSTDFAFSRFLVPHLCDYQGWAIYMDCDMLAREDLLQLWLLRDERFALMCVKHPEYQPAESTKFLGQRQSIYPRKNWSSLMLFNNARCAGLTPKLVSTADGLFLHQFRWLGESDIGALAPRWNHLVGVQRHEPNAAIAHFTLGGPYFREYEDCPFAAEWREAMGRALVPYDHK